MSLGCPDPAILIQLGTPSFETLTSGPIIEHVDQCAVCQAVLQDFVRDGLDSSGCGRSSFMANDEHVPVIPGFTIEKRLGEGASGVVYLARQETIGRLVALKLILGGKIAAEEERRAWLREVRAASKVRHPSIVALHDCGEAGPWFFLVLEYVAGGSLDKRLDGPLTPRESARLVELVARAVDRLHTEGLRHLDLKPSNILLDGDEDTRWDQVVPKVTDFGIARTEGDPRTTLGMGKPFGTPAYMAPEQTGIAGVPIGPAADIHALGAILYQLLTGRPPIQRNTAAETLMAIRTEEPIPARRMNSSLPRDLETICSRCLEKAPEKRFRSALELAEDLQRFSQQRPIKARPVSPLEQGWRWCRRRPAIAVLAATLVATIASAGCGLILVLNEANAQRSQTEANYLVASDALQDALELSDMVAAGNHGPGDEPRTRLLKSIHVKQLRLVNERPRDLAARRQLVRIDMALGKRLHDRGLVDEARPFFEQSATLLHDLSGGGSGSAEDSFCLMKCYQYLSSVFVNKGNTANALAYMLEACKLWTSYDVAFQKAHVDSAVISFLCVGESLAILGRLDEARDWLQTHRHWLDMLDSTNTQLFSVPVFRVRWLKASGQRDSAIEFAISKTKTFPKDADLGLTLADMLMQKAAEFSDGEQRRPLYEIANVALSSITEPTELQAAEDPGNPVTLRLLAIICQIRCQCLVALKRGDEVLPVFERLVTAKKMLLGRQSFEPAVLAPFWRVVVATASIVDRFLLQTDEPKHALFLLLMNDLGLPAEFEFELQREILKLQFEATVHLRHARQFAKAKQLADSVVKKANRLATICPQNFESHLLLSEAYVQVAKNCWDPQDNHSIHAGLRAALDAAENALKRFPENPKVIELVEDRRQRLANAPPFP